MARKIVLCILFVSAVVLFYAYAGEVKLTTYYPAPYGEYKKMVAKTLGVGDTNNDGSVNGSDAPDPATKSGDVWIRGNVGINMTQPIDGKLSVKSHLNAISSLRILGSTAWFRYGDGDVSYDDLYAPAVSEVAGTFISADDNASNSVGIIGIGDYRSTMEGGTLGAYGGVFGANVASGSTGNAYGVYIKKVTASGGTAYGVYSGAGRNYFAGNVGIGTTDPAQKLEVDGIVRLGVPNDATKVAEIYMSSGASNWGGNKFLLRFPSTIATSANDEMWIGIGGGSGSLRGGYVGHIQLVAENIHLSTSNDSGPVGSRDGLTTLTGGVMIMANESGLMVPRNTNAVTKPLRDGTLNGTIYYNTSTNKFQGCENGIWKNLGGGGGVVSGSYTGGGASKKITLSPAFRPNLVTIINNRPCEFIKMSSMSGQTAFTQGAGIVGEGQAQYGNYVRIEDDGFTVYGNANKSGQTHYYVAY